MSDGTPVQERRVKSGAPAGATSGVQVVVRMRPLNEEEKKSSNTPVVTTHTESGEVSITKGKTGGRTSYAYHFDQVFGSFATQEEVYDATLLPVIQDVLDGFECSVFAYGQTGTGKTHTMEGDLSNGFGGGEGVIPRAANTIFARLQALPGAIYSVKCTYLEVYNEELSDLLVDNAEEAAAFAGKAKGGKAGGKPGDKGGAAGGVALQLVEDVDRDAKTGKVSRKGVYCRGLREVEVADADAILALLRQAQTHRQTAETKMNKASSRSHCLFTMAVYSKAPTGDGGLVLERAGKLHLCDLAGSENAKTAGTGGDRAKLRESMNINQSLLTLGRVITALKEKSPRIPYRDSKLTRLLQVGRQPPAADRPQPSTANC